jgi:hypothetical protein
MPISVTARCQAMAVRSWNTPASSLGSDRCLAKITRIRARLAVSTTRATLAVNASASGTCRTMPACMS